jgi:hypothetical protein
MSRTTVKTEGEGSRTPPVTIEGEVCEEWILEYFIFVTNTSPVFNFSL